MHESHLSTLFVFNQPKTCFHKGRLNIWLILDFFMVDQIKKDKFIELTQKAIKKYRENLLDISNRNNLINLNFNPRSNKVLRIIDEIPNSVFQKLSSNKKLKLVW